MSIPFLAFTADSAQQANLAGGSWLVKINCEHIMKTWPLAGDVVNGVIQKLPLLRADAGLAIIKPVPGTLRYKFPNIGSHGHQHYRHEISYEVANESEAITAELEKDLNSKSVFIVMKPDGRMIVLGTSSAGLMVTNDGDSGEEGGENKTSVSAYSDVQMGRPKFLLASLEDQIRMGNDGYSLTLTSTLGTLATVGNTALAGINLRNISNAAIPRKYAVNDLVKINSLNTTSYALGIIESLPDTAGYITARVSAVYNMTAQPSGYIDKIDIDTIIFQNVSIALARPYIIQKI